MPLFHIHGIVCLLLSTLFSGSSIFPSPGFDALKFFSWIKKFSPSWYSAVPTMHQAILMRADRNSEIIAETKLRFIRSSSASLPSTTMKEIENTFANRCNNPRSTKCLYLSCSSDFPSATRDISFLLHDETLISELENVLLNFKSENLKEAFVFDFYKKNPDNIKMGFRFIFQSKNHTITDTEVNDVISIAADGGIKTLELTKLDVSKLIMALQWNV